MRKLLSGIIYSNLLISIAAGAQVALTYLLLGLPFAWHVVLSVGSGALLLYNYSVWCSLPSHRTAITGQRALWFVCHQCAVSVFSVVAIMLLVVGVSQMRVFSILFLALLGLVAFLYNTPLLTWRGRRVGLRQVAYLKIWMIAAIWTLCTVGLVLCENYERWGGPQISAILWLMSSRFVFLLAAALPFDVRDVKQDRYYGLRTLPTCIGQKGAVWSNYLLVMLHSLLVGFSPMDAAIKGALLSTDIVFLVVLFTVIYRRSEVRPQTVFLADAILIVQWLAVWWVS